MPVEIRVPSLGESIVEATVGRWLKQEGDAVAAGEDVVELETDKVNALVPADSAGILERISRQVGEVVGVNEVLGVVTESAAGSNGQKAAPVVEAAPTNAAATATVPVTENGHDRVPATSVARSVAREHGVDIADVEGSGPGGRRVKTDVEMHIAQTVENAASGQAPATPPAPVKPTVEVARSTNAPPPAVSAPRPQTAVPVPAPAAASGRGEQVIPMSRRRRVIADNLVRAQHNAAMLTTFNEVDMTAIMEVRKRRKETFEKRFGVGLGFMSFFTKAAVGALKAFPYLNAEIRGTDIVVKNYYDIGIAVGAEEGLVVPIVRDADRKTFADIEKEIKDLAGRARDNKLTASELMGGTFTLTNGGIFGSLMSTPILNAPQVGILGMHKIQERAMVVNSEIVVRPMMYLALSYDHRIVDGSEAVRFLVRLKELVEDPENLLLEG